MNVSQRLTGQPGGLHAGWNNDKRLRHGDGGFRAGDKWSRNQALDHTVRLLQEQAGFL